MPLNHVLEGAVTLGGDAPQGCANRPRTALPARRRGLRWGEARETRLQDQIDNLRMAVSDLRIELDVLNVAFGNKSWPGGPPPVSF